MLQMALIQSKKRQIKCQIYKQADQISRKYQLLLIYKQSKDQSSEEQEDSHFTDMRSSKIVQKTAYIRLNEKIQSQKLPIQNNTSYQSQQTEYNQNQLIPLIYNQYNQKKTFNSQNNNNFQSFYQKREGKYSGNIQNNSHVNRSQNESKSNLVKNKNNSAYICQNEKYKREQIYTRSHLSSNIDVQYEKKQLYTSSHISKSNNEQNSHKQNNGKKDRNPQNYIQSKPQKSQKKQHIIKEKLLIIQSQFENNLRDPILKKQNILQRQIQNNQTQQYRNKFDQAFINMSHGSNNQNQNSYRQSQNSQRIYNNRQNDSYSYVKQQQQFLQDTIFNNNRKNHLMSSNKKRNHKNGSSDKKNGKENKNASNKKKENKEEEQSDWDIEYENKNQDQDDYQRSPNKKKSQKQKEFYDLQKQIKKADISFIKSQHDYDLHNMANLSIHPDEDEELVNNIIDNVKDPKTQMKNLGNHKLEQNSQIQNQKKIQYDKVKSKILFNVLDQQKVLHFLQKHKDLKIKSDIQLSQKVTLHIKIQSTNLSKIWIKKISIPCFGIKNYKIIKNVNENNENSQMNNQKKFVSINKNWTGVLDNSNIMPFQLKQKSQIELCQILDPYRCIKLYHESKQNQKLFANSQQGQDFKKQIAKTMQKMHKILKSSQKLFENQDPIQQQIYDNLLSNKFSFLKIQEIKIACRACYTKSESLFLDQQNFQRIHCEKCSELMTIQITQETISVSKSKPIQTVMLNDI